MKGTIIMAHRPSWKVLTVSAAIAGLGIAGTGFAIADSSDTSGVQPIEVTSNPASPAADDAGTNNPGNTGQADDNTPDNDTPDGPDNTPDNDTPDNDTPDGPDNTPDNDSPDEV